MTTKESMLDVIRNNWGSFLLGWIIGAGLFPMLVEQISAAF